MTDLNKLMSEPAGNQHILGIDPGTEKSAFVIVSGPDEPFKILELGILENEDLLNKIRLQQFPTDFAIEMIASYGMSVGQTTFETCFWIGRFWEAACRNTTIVRKARLFRKTDIDMHLCHSTRARDSNVRQALIDRFGEPGTKAQPGALYKVVSHIWSALAVATVYRDRLEVCK